MTHCYNRNLQNSHFGCWCWRRMFKMTNVAPLSRFIAQYGGSCGAAVETAGRRMVLQLENRLRESLERLRLKEQNLAAARNSIGNSNHLEVTLQQLISTVQTQANRLANLETSCFSSPGTGMGMNSKRSLLPEGGAAEILEQEVTSRQAALNGLQAALLQVRVGLAEVLSSSQQRYIPAGETSILPAAVCPHLLSLSSHWSFHLHSFFSVDIFRSGFSLENQTPPPLGFRVQQLILPEFHFLRLM